MVEENKENIGSIVLRKAKSSGLVIGRIPKKTKKEFILFAEEEFEDDYGMALKYIWDNFKIWALYFNNLDFKLDKILASLDNKEEDSISLLSGDKIKLKGGKKDEKK